MLCAEPGANVSHATGKIFRSARQKTEESAPCSSLKERKTAGERPDNVTSFII